MDGNDTGTEGEPLHPQVVADDVDEGDDNGTYVAQPSKLIRIASMTRAMLEEVKAAPLDEAGRHRVLGVYESSLEELRDGLSSDLREEMSAVFKPFSSDTATESELRLVQAQLIGWLEGLYSGIQASLFSQRAATEAQLDEMRRERSLEAGDVQRNQGKYL